MKFKNLLEFDAYFVNQYRRMRSFLCGISMAMRYALVSATTKTYYDVETALSLPGATLFYASISFIG